MSAPRILVVEDDSDISLMLKLMFERKGFSAITATREDEVHSIMHNNSVDLVIMDMLLSGVNGVDICTTLKQNHKTSHIPVVMTSAHPNAEAACIAAGADDFISKPFEMKEMLSHINRLLNSENSSNNSTNI